MGPAYALGTAGTSLVPKDFYSNVGKDLIKSSDEVQVGGETDCTAFQMISVANLEGVSLEQEVNQRLELDTDREKIMFPRVSLVIC